VEIRGMIIRGCWRDGEKESEDIGGRIRRRKF
jgi:hypothetical protein